jgi:hypothetical protein
MRPRKRIFHFSRSTLTKMQHTTFDQAVANFPAVTGTPPDSQ